MPLIRDYVAEHERATALADAAVRAIEADDLQRAEQFLASMADELGRHWKGEEDGIFHAMAARDQEYASYVAPLVLQHRELALQLATVDVADRTDQGRLKAAFDALAEHISKEEDGLFPASLIALGGSDWNASMAAWA